MFRTYAFSGRKSEVLAILSIAFSGLVGVIIWVTSKSLTCLFRIPCLWKCIPDCSMGPQYHSCSFLLHATAVSQLRINQPWTSSWRPLHQTRHRSPFPITWACVYNFVLLRSSTHKRSIFGPVDLCTVSLFVYCHPSRNSFARYSQPVSIASTCS